MLTQEQLDALTPSSMLEYMLEGIISHKDLENFKFNLNSFGHKEETGLCLGCIATVAIASMNDTTWTKAVSKCGGKPGWSNRVPKSLSRQVDDMEESIDDARLGWVSSLFRFCNLPANYNFDDEFYICEESDIEAAIPEIQEVIGSLKAAGF